MISKTEIKQIKSLSRNKGRKIYGEYLIEGLRTCSTALEAGAAIHKVIVTEHFLDLPDHQALITQIRQRGIPFTVVSETVMKSVATTVTPPGILGVCPLPEDSNALPVGDRNWLYLDSLQDPGNMGTLFRTAAWFNIQYVALSRTCIDPFNPKVVRSSMGTHFHLSLFRNIDIQDLESGDHALLGADPKGTPIDDMNLSNLKPWVLVLGNEASGLTPEVKNRLRQTIAIEPHGKGESLNVAVAGGILLYYLTRDTV